MQKNITFKGNKISRTTVKNNIIKVLDHSMPIELSDWYADAHNFCQYVSDKYTIPLDKVIGIVAALSPRKEWNLNKRIAIDLIENGHCGQIGVFVNKAIDITDRGNSESKILSILNGQKISAFFMNIKYPDCSDNVTIDRHAISVALGHIASDNEQSMTAKEYTFFKDCYIFTARKLGIKPLLLQSITWMTWKRIK